MDKFFDSLHAFPFHRGPKRMVAGIAGGIADKFGWDVTLVRIGMLLAFLLPGWSASRATWCCGCCSRTRTARSCWNG